MQINLCTLCDNVRTVDYVYYEDVMDVDVYDVSKKREDDDSVSD